MKERPILFSAPMVRALLEGRKTQTRRVLNNKAKWHFFDGDGDLTLCPYGQPGDRLWVRETLRVCSDGIEYTADEHLGFDLAVCPDYAADLWNQYAHEDGPDLKPTKIPSIFMPRWASRITLEITDVRVQRLQEISEEDAGCEGIYETEFYDRAEHMVIGGAPWSAERLAFADLWDSINAKKHPWDSNPWVWAITFEARP